MYRLPITLLWTSAAAFTAIATTDAIYGYAGQARDLWIGIASTSAICATILHIGRAIITTNARRNQQLTSEVQGDVGQLRDQVGEVRDWVEAGALIHGRTPPDSEPDNDGEQDRPLATVHQFRLRRGDQDVIYGSRSAEPADPNEVWRALDDEEPGRGHVGAS